jgi:hypothetical protein
MLGDDDHVESHFLGERRVAHEHLRVELLVTAEIGETRDGMLLGGRRA